MSAELNDLAGASPAAPATAISTPRPFYWSVRRELWENRAVFIAPAIVAGLVLLGFVISFFSLRHGAYAMAKLTPAAQAVLFAIPYSFAAAAVIIAAFIVGFFYCLGALYNERRDRSLLFWKSLPVSDLTTVLAKLSIPLAALPAVSLVVIVVTQVIMLALNTVGRLVIGESVEVLWSNIPLLRIDGALIYGLVALALWHAPIYAWLLLISSWAKRSPILWAILPPLGVALVEKIGFNTHYFPDLLGYRLVGVAHEAFIFPPHIKGQFGGQPEFNPLGFVATPGLWLGLVFAAACIAGAVWMRRRREAL